MPISRIRPIISTDKVHVTVKILTWQLQSWLSGSFPRESPSTVWSACCLCMEWNPCSAKQEIGTGLDYQQLEKLTYRQNAWNEVWCSNICGKAPNIKQCMCALPPMHKLFVLWIGPKDIVCYNLTSIAIHKTVTKTYASNV